jgi:hypothetical protein|nr:MAG TPA: putative tail-component [Caudoviricetes sp.]
MGRYTINLKVENLYNQLLQWSKKLENNLVDAVDETIKIIWDDVVENAPVRSGVYVSSIKITSPEIENEIIKAKVFSDLLVGGDNPKWAKVPLSALLEWGTGIVGQNSNTYPHGYGYRLTPWCYYDQYLHIFVTTTGMIARPHFYPALVNNRETFINEIRKRVEKSWMK